MKQILSENDRSILDRLIAGAEAKTGVQIVLATVNRSDSYAEIPWKAFAFGISVAGLAVFIFNLFVLQWVTVTIILISVAAILAAGVVLVLLTLFFPAFARLFLSVHRKETETMQYAESLFLSHELFATKGRSGILLMVSHFEKQVVILPDTGVRSKLSVDVMNNIFSKMTQHLSHNKVRLAFETGLDELISVLSDSASGKTYKNELPDEIIEEAGI